MNKHLEIYKKIGFPNVEGWCDIMLFDVIDALDSLTFNKSGGCLEIGVHHGKFYLLLNQVIAPEFRSYAVDIFDRQELNIDQSGKGVLDQFKNNLKLYDFHHGENTDIIMGDSTDPALRIEEKIGLGKCRFISIDGGHTAEHTISDLGLSAKLVCNEGVVILDDILNYHWLGVIEGVNMFLGARPTLVPFAIGFNKLFMCKLSYQYSYFDAFVNHKLKTKITRFYGHKLVAF